MPELTANATLLAAGDIARAALADYASSPSAIGRQTSHVVEDENVVSFHFECLDPGYPGWEWVVTLTAASETEPVTVLEAELLPGEHALIAPPWVPWSERIADYRAQQIRDMEAAAEEIDGTLVDLEGAAEPLPPVPSDELAGIDDIDETDFGSDEPDVIDDDTDEP